MAGSYPRAVVHELVERAEVGRHADVPGIVVRPLLHLESEVLALALLAFPLQLVHQPGRHQLVLPALHEQDRHVDVLDLADRPVAVPRYQPQQSFQRREYRRHHVGCDVVDAGEGVLEDEALRRVLELRPREHVDGCSAS